MIARFVILVVAAATVASAIDCAPPDVDCAQWNGVCAPLADGCPEGTHPIPGVPCNSLIGGFNCLCCASAEIDDQHLTELDCPCETVDCGNSTCLAFYQANCTEICLDTVDNNCDSTVDEITCDNATFAPTASPTLSPTASSSSSSSESDDDESSVSYSDSESSSSDEDRSRRRHRRPRRQISWYWKLFGYDEDDDDADDLAGVGVLFTLAFVVCICVMILASMYMIGAPGDEIARPPPVTLAPVANTNNAPVPLRQNPAPPAARAQFTATVADLWKDD